MKLPYGLSDFKKLRTGDYLYIDKTNYIKKLEEISSDYLFFIRPRRFGKSLFLSTLKYYYDLNHQDKFEQLFGNLYIANNKTKLKNSYFILELNFSGLNTDTKDKLEESFRAKLRAGIIEAIEKYQDYFEKPQEIIKDINQVDDIGAILQFFISAVKKTDKKVYLIVDEYDHFANHIIAMGNEKFYKEIIRATGFVRDFYETVKIGTESVIDQIFITGISPIMLDDLTSGFNISTNLTMNPIVNQMLGFTEREVEGIIEQLDVEAKKQELMKVLRENYNGYLFNQQCEERVYNPDMVLYFFNQWQMTGDYPQNLIDDNVKTDYGRLDRLVTNQDNRKILEQIIQQEGITSDIITKFSFDRMYDQEYFVSLLFYMGLLTIKGTRYGKIRLGIPNYVTKTIFWEYFERKLKEEYNIKYNTEELAKSIWEMGFDGEIKPFLEYISSQVLKQLSNRDLLNFDEKYIKVILFSYLITSNLYHPISEREVENGYIDIYLEKDIRMPDLNYEWILELKYLKKSDKDQLDAVKVEGLKQLQNYAVSRNMEDKENVKQALIIFVGKDEYVIEKND
jgi:hypothetical protein